MSSKQFTAQTFAWLRLLKSDRDMTALAVGVQLTEHFNEDEGGCAWAGCGYMAEALGLNKATVVRAVHRMHARGRLRVEWGKQGRGHSNQYWMIVKDAPAHLLDPEKDAPEPAVANYRKGAPASRKGAPAHLNHLKNHVEGAKAPSTKGRERRELALAGPSAAPAVGGAHEGREVAVDRFADLWALWSSARSWPDSDVDEATARRSFDIACREADPDEITAAARAWISAVDPRYVPTLSKWLLGRGFQKQPPARRHRTNGGKVSLSNLALEIGNQWGRS